MSVESMSATLRLQGLPPVEKLLLLGIANHDGDGGAWPSMATLAMYVGLSVRQTQRTLHKLVDRGLVEVGVNEGGNSKTKADRRPNLYVLHLDGVTSERDGVTSEIERGDIATSSRGVTPDVTRTVPRTVQETSNKEHAQTTSVCDAWFDAFWDLYPRKVGKKTAEKAFAIAWNRVDLDVSILNALQARVKWWANMNTPMDKIPYPASWLNGERWNDEIEPAAPRTPTAYLLPPDATEAIADWLSDIWAPVPRTFWDAVRVAVQQGFGPGEIAVRIAVQMRFDPLAFADKFAIVNVKQVSRFPGGVPESKFGPKNYTELMDRAYQIGKWVL